MSKHIFNCRTVDEIKNVLLNGTSSDYVPEDSIGNNPVHHFIINDRPEVLKYYLKFLSEKIGKDDVKKVINKKNKYAHTPLYYIDFKHRDNNYYELLIKYGLNPFIPVEGNKVIISDYFKKKYFKLIF